MTRVPSYVKLLTGGELRERADRSWTLLEECRLCPRLCESRRGEGEKGVCRTANRAVVSSYGPHFGEEDPLTGWRGSGTIFFAYCPLGCIFCQNYDISHNGEGEEVDTEELAGFMLSLQQRGCHNINLVTPTHVVPQILQALCLAAEKGLRLPLVYNTGGYDRVETLRLLDGVVDIYMPDMKYADGATAKALSLAGDYPERNREAVREMHRQVGDLVIDEHGLAVRGLLVRHLVLPERLAGTREIMRFLVREVSPATYVNIMAQYYPAYRAHKHPALSRRVTREEYLEAVDIAREEGITRLEGF